jgi:hypothetical protein
VEKNLTSGSEQMEKSLDQLNEILGLFPDMNQDLSRKENRKVVLFLSFDIYHSTALKTQARNWKEIIDLFFENKFPGMKLWKFNGDELIYKSETNSIRFICKMIKDAHKHVLFLQNKLSTKHSSAIYVKATVWIALTDEEADDNAYVNNYRLSINGIEDYIGRNIDEGFRLTKYSSLQKVAIDPKIIFILANVYNNFTLKEDEIRELFLGLKGDIKSELIEIRNDIKQTDSEDLKNDVMVSISEVLNHVVQIGYTKFKGIWNERLYPVFWFYIESEYCVQYDELFNNKLVKEIVEKQQNKKEQTDFGYYSELLRVFVQVGIMRDVLEIAKKMTMKHEDKEIKDSLRTIYHHSVICVDQHEKKVMIAKRRSDSSFLKDIWDFGSIELKYVSNVKDAIEKQYEEIFGVSINLYCDTMWGGNPVVLGMYSVSDSESVHNFLFLCASIKNKNKTRDDTFPKCDYQEIKYVDLKDIVDIEELSFEKMEKYNHIHTGLICDVNRNQKSIACFETAIKRAFEISKVSESA